MCVTPEEFRAGLPTALSALETQAAYGPVSLLDHRDLITILLSGCVNGPDV